MKLGQHKEAKQCHEKALMIREKIYDEQHAKVKQSCENLRVVFNRDLTQYNQDGTNQCVVL